MIKEAMEWLKANASHESALTAEQMPLWSTREWKQLKPCLQDCMQLSTLSGIVDYQKKNLTEAEPKTLAYHVVSPHQVDLVLKELDPWGRRVVLASTKASDFVKSTNWLGNYYDQEDFVVMAQERFSRDENQAKLVKVIGNITSDNTTELNDDGVTQRVSQRKGVTLKSSSELPVPIELKAYRSFTELAEQPTCPYLVRVRGNQNPEIALFEVDGGKWKDVAMSMIYEHLSTVLKTECDVIC